MINFLITQFLFSSFILFQALHRSLIYLILKVLQEREFFECDTNGSQLSYCKKKKKVTELLLKCWLASNLGDWLGSNIA